MAKYLSDAGSSMPFKKPSKISSESIVDAEAKKRKKKEKSLRRFIPSIFTNKDSGSSGSGSRNKVSSDKSLELAERKRRSDDRYYSHHHYQQHGSRTNRCSDPLYLRNDNNIHVNSNPSLSGSMIEERLNEIKHDLFPVQAGASTPDHYLHAQENAQQMQYHQHHHRQQQQQQQQQQHQHQHQQQYANCRADVSYNLDGCCDENKWMMDGNIISGSPNIPTLNHHHQHHDQVEKENAHQCQLKRHYSFQDPAGSPFRRNCGPSGRISAPPSERFLIRPRAIHPTDRPLPEIPQKAAFAEQNGVCYVKYPQEAWKDNKQQLQQQQQQFKQQSENARSASPCSSLKSADEYADSSYTANSSQKSEFSPTSSKSGEYYLTNESRASNQSSSNDSLVDQSDCAKPRSINVEINNKQEHFYDKTPCVNNLELSQESEPQDDLYESKSISAPIYDEAEAKVFQDELYDVPPPPPSPPPPPLLHDDDDNVQQDNSENDENCKVVGDISIEDNYEQQQQQQEQQQNSNNNSPRSCDKNVNESSESATSISCTQQGGPIPMNSPVHSSSQPQLVLDTKPVISHYIRKKNYQPQNTAQPIDQVLIASPPQTPMHTYSPPTTTTSAAAAATTTTTKAASPATAPTANNSLNVAQDAANDLYDIPASENNGQVVKRQQPSSPNKNRRPDAIYVYSTASSTPSPSLSNQMNYENVYASRKAVASSRKSLSPTPSSSSEQQQQQRQQQPMSPQKRKMMQHLEAYYWQQRAVDAQKRSSLNAATMDAHEYAYWKQMQAAANKDRAMLIYEEHNRQMLAQQHLHQQQQQQQQQHQSHAYYGSLKKNGAESAYAPTHVIYQKPLRQPVLVVRPQQCARSEIRVHKGSPVQRSVSCSPGSIATAAAAAAPDYGTVSTKRVSFSSQGSKQAQWPTKHGPAPEPPTRRNKVMESPVYNSSSPTLSQSSKVSEDYEANKPLPPIPVQQQHLQQHQQQHWSLVKRPTTLTKDDGSEIQERKDDTGCKLQPAFSESESGSEAGEVQRIMQQRQNARMLIRWKSKDKASSKSSDGGGGGGGGGGGQGKKKRKFGKDEEEWNADAKNRYTNESGGTGKAEGEGPNDHAGRRIVGGVGVGIGGGGGGGGGLGPQGQRSGGVGAAGRSRDEPRRHTLSGDHQPSAAALLHHQQFTNAVAVAHNAAQGGPGQPGQPIHPLHPRHLPPPHAQYGLSSRHTTMDLEMGTKSRQRKSPLPRGYPPNMAHGNLFDDDPGIMSEVETSSTGFRRGGKQRSSLPVVRTPSKTLERPLGLVFLQYRNETKRALLPNEITSIDTVKALFVRSFPKQLTMEYLDSPHVKIYIHDSNKDMFYELEDLRSHLRDIRDRSVLRLFESDGVAGMPGSLGVPGGPMLPSHWEDQSYFSEPEFDSEFQHQHIHKSKSAKSGSSSYYMSGSSTLPRGGALLRPYSPATGVLPGPNAAAGQPKALGTPGTGAPPAKPLRNYHCKAPPLGSLGSSRSYSRDSTVSLYSIPDRLHGESGYMSSPERGGAGGVVPVGGSAASNGPGSTTANRYPPGPYSAGSSYEDPYYSQYSGTVTPVIDEEASDTELLEESYSLYGVKPAGRPPSGPPRSPFGAPPGAPPPTLLPTGQPYDATRIRVEHMERQLANLTGLVQKALTQAPHPSPSPRDYLQVPSYSRSAGDEFDRHSSSSSASLPPAPPPPPPPTSAPPPDDTYLRSDVKPPKLGKDKSVSFEKSVSFSDEPPDMNSPKQHSPQHTADSKPTKPAIKSSTLPRMSSQERDSRHKPTPPPKPTALAPGQYVCRDLALTPEMYNQLRGLQKKAKDLRQEIKNLRRMSQAQAHTVRETIRDTFITIRAMLLSSGDNAWASGDAEKIRLSREEDLYKQEMLWLEKDLTGLESTVEELRGNVINRKTRVNMSDVENMALILSKASKTVADLKVRFPNLQEGMKGLLSSEMEKVMREEKFLKEEPDRLESALKRCKKLTGTLVTLKRLASVQEQRLPNSGSVEAEEAPPITPTSAQHSKAPVPAERSVVGAAFVSGGSRESTESSSHGPGGHTQRPENALDALLDELQTFSRPASQLSHVSSTGAAPAASATSAAAPAPPAHPSELARSGSGALVNRAPNMAEIGRKGSVDSSCMNNLLPPGQSGTLRRLHSYPSGSDTDTSPPVGAKEDGPATLNNGQDHPGQIPPKPPVPERNAELLQLATARRMPPPPPPRTSSRSPLASPTSPQLPPRNPSVQAALRNRVAAAAATPPLVKAFSENNHKAAAGVVEHPASNSSSCESVNSQEGLQTKKERQEQLEQRHQELLRKQKALQEQYARLQLLQRNASGCAASVPPTPPDLLKKTGSESNLLAKMGLGLATTTSGSLSSLGNAKSVMATSQTLPRNSTVPVVTSMADGVAPCATEQSNAHSTVNANSTTTAKVYETDIL